MTDPKAREMPERKRVFEKMFSHLDLNSIGGKNYTSKRTNTCWKGFEAAWNIRDVAPDTLPPQSPDQGAVEKTFVMVGDIEYMHRGQAEEVVQNMDREIEALKEQVQALTRTPLDLGRKFQLGDLVTKTKGSKWTGKVVGFYSTELTPVGYAVESQTETGSVQIYPEQALQAIRPDLFGK